MRKQVFGRFREADDFSIFVIHQLGKNTVVSKAASAIHHRHKLRYLATVPKIAGSIRRIQDFLFQKNLKGSFTFPVAVPYRFLVLFRFVDHFSGRGGP